MKKYVLRSLKYYTNDKERRKKYLKDNWEELSKKNAKYHQKNKKRQNQQKRDWYYNKGNRFVL